MKATVEKLDPYKNAVEPHSTKDVRRAKDVLRTAELSADRNRWFVVSLALVCVIVVLVVLALKLSSMSDYKVAWVKLEPGGTWDIELSGTQSPQQIYRRTVDSILAKWVKRRFSEQPETIRSDYGYVLQFLVPRLKADFTAESGFNAAQKAADIRSNPSHGAVIYEVGTIHHYDVDLNGLIDGRIDTDINRTNVYVRRKALFPSGAQRSEPEERRIMLEWRLMTLREINLIVKKDGGIDWLRENPIGLEILSYEEANDFPDRQ